MKKLSHTNLYNIDKNNLKKKTVQFNLLRIRHYEMAFIIVKLKSNTLRKYMHIIIAVFEYELTLT
jgi:hypothetical protein